MIYHCVVAEGCSLHHTLLIQPTGLLNCGMNRHGEGQEQNLWGHLETRVGVLDDY